MLLLVALPPVEEIIFRIAPHRCIGRIIAGNNAGRNAAFVGSIIWAGLHLFGRNLAAGGMYKESILFHEAFNFLPLLTCFLF
jgi:hypothetical protein